jgi:hypothetical protein
VNPIFCHLSFLNGIIGVARKEFLEARRLPYGIYIGKRAEHNPLNFQRFLASIDAASERVKSYPYHMLLNPRRNLADLRSPPDEVRLNELNLRPGQP